MSNSTRPIRVVTFPERPDALLIVVSEGMAGPVRLPALPVPFGRQAVADALRMAKVEARVGEELPGRWTGAMLRARREAKAEATQRGKLANLTAASLGAQSADDFEAKRGAALLAKIKTEEEVAALKKQIADAKTRAFERGEFMDRRAFTRLEARLEAAKVEAQRLGAELFALKAAHKAANAAKHEAREKRFERRFIEIAKELLDPEDFADICEAAQDEDEP